MMLATLPSESPDGILLVVSGDCGRFFPQDRLPLTCNRLSIRGTEQSPALRRLAARVNAGEGEALASHALAAPLPRAWQWLDGSGFDSHGRLMAKLFGAETQTGGSSLDVPGYVHQFLGPTANVPLPGEAHGIDFEGEFGIITGAVPMGVSAAQAGDYIRLVVMINDWSLDDGCKGISSNA